MLAYAAHRRSARRVSPATLALIVGGHAVAIGLLITAKMDVGPGKKIVDTVIEFIPAPIPETPPPPPPMPQTEVRPSPKPSTVTQTPAVVELDHSGPTVDLGPPTTEIVPDLGPIIETPPGPIVQDPPRPAPVKIAARSITPAEYLRPEYPDSKRRLEEEAVLRLRLQIDERGRVVAVEPVGDADAAFVTAARQHLLRHWRYKPATEDGRPVPTSMTITLRFQLED